jgi:serine/threonine-protein kinase
MEPIVLVTIATVFLAGSARNLPDEPPRASANLAPAVTVALSNGRMAESQGRTEDALRSYGEAAAGGSGEAARRIGDIYWHGAPGVHRDFAESMRWYRQAEVHGERLAQAVRLR